MAKAKAAAVEYDESKIPQEEQDAVRKLLNEIERAKTLRKDFDEKTLPKLRRYAWGTRTGEQGAQGSAESTTRTNLIFATLATLLPHIYAKNPEISVSPTEAVGENEYENVKEFGKTCQGMLNNLLVEEARLKSRHKANIRSAMTTSVGWLKMGFQESLEGDPIFVNRANDMQDNLRRIEYLIGLTKKETDLTRLNEQRAELKQQLSVVRESPEMKIFKGFVIDRVATEDVFILDEGVTEFEDYVHASKIAHRITMTDDEYYETFGHNVPKDAPSYEQKRKDESGNDITLNDSLKVRTRAVFEVWDKTTNQICCVCEGMKSYSKKPYILKPASERWYSFFALGFNLVEGRWRPLSDIELLMHLQDEYNTTRYLFAETRKESIPVRFYRKGGSLKEEDLKEFATRKARDIIGIGGNPSVPLSQDIMQLEGLSIDPEAFDVTIIRNDMDMLVGLSDASRASLIEAKTATEAEIMRQALQNRVAERQDTNEDLTAEMATAALEIMLQKFSKNEVMDIVGEGAVWPELTEVETIFRKIRVTVRAGSTGKPNLLKERESWAQIMPIINETVTRVMELRTAGQFDMAESSVALLRETLRRYDEKIDVEEFIPEQERDEEGNPVAVTNAIAQQQEMQEQMKVQAEELKAAQEEIQQLQLQLTQAKNNDVERAAKAEADAAIKVAQEQAKAAEARAKEAEAMAKEAEAEAKAQKEYDLEVYKIDKQAETTKEVEKMKIESNERVNTENAKNKKDLAVQAGREKGVKGPEDIAHEKEQLQGVEQVAAALASAAEGVTSAAQSLDKAAQAVAQAASMDRVPEYDGEGRIVRVKAQSSKGSVQ